MFKVLVKLHGESPRVETVEEFPAVVFEAFGGPQGSPYPAMSSSGKIYMVGYNSEQAQIIAFAVLPLAEFRARLIDEAEKRFTAKMQKAAEDAAASVSELYEIALRFQKRE